MRPFASTITLSEAQAILADVSAPVERRERVSLEHAACRVLADPLVARLDVPPFDRSAMDGYAVQARDTAAASTAAPCRLRVTGSVFAGEASRSTIERGACATIATGAPLPPGSDAVVPVEHTRGAGDLVEILAPVAVGQNVGPRGCDITAGQSVLSPGTLLTPARIGAIAALGLAEVEVYARPRAFVASTGNELALPGATLAPGQIFDINRYTLPPVIAVHGGEVVCGNRVGDTVDALRATLDEATRAAADLIVLSGGSSVGDRDLLVDAARERGEVLFHGIAVRPGKPTLLARLGSALLLGMPGNPTSCLSNAYILLVPLVRKLAHLPPWRPDTREVPLSRDVSNASGRYTFFTVRLEADQAVPAFKGSGDITSLAHADGYIEIPAEVTRLAAGSVVRVVLF